MKLFRPKTGGDERPKMDRWTGGLPPAPKPVHRAALIRKDGAVSPRCAERPRKINLARETWTLVDALVTCKWCLRSMRGGGK